MSQQNIQVRLANRPVGEHKSSDFEVDSGPVPQPCDGQVQVRVCH
jgi:NADPH-dependent curcumin reductase CurA